MPKKIHASLGHHYIVEASECDPKIIGRVDKVQQILVKAAEEAGAQVWSISFSKFPPKGVSGVVVISESHISTHTWPEHKYAAFDIYTCGDSIDPEKAVIYVLEAFGASTSHITEITRGIDEGDKIYFHSIITWEEDFEKEEEKEKEQKRSKRSPKKK
jgi:S-adenosylmethionine decarboxylase